MMMMDTLDASSSTASASQPMDVVPAVALAATTVVDFTATMVNMAATAESNNNHIVEMISSSEYKEHRKNKKKKREKREKDKEHRHHKHRREHRRDRDRDRDRDHHHHHHGNSHNSSQHSTSASSSPSSASTTPSATIEYVGGSASASPSYLGGGGSVSAAASGASNSSNSTATTYPHNLKIRFLLSGQRTELSPPTHQSSATAEVNATLAPATCAAISTTSATGSSSSSGSTTTANTSSSNIASGSTATIGSNNNATTGSAGLPPSNFAKADLSKTIGSGTKHGTNGGIKDTSSTSGSSSSSSSGNQQQATGANTNAPSLYVSVPLSTANVPGINLPNASGSVTGNGTGTSIDSSQSAIRSGSTPALSNPSLSNQQSQSSLGTTGSAAYVTPHTANSLSGIPTTSASSSSSSLSALSSSVIQHQHPSGKSSTSASALSGGTSGALVSGNCGGNIISSTSTSTTTHSSGNLTATTTESGNLKISYEKQTNRVQQLQEQESSPGRRSRTPDLNSGTVSTSAISAASGNSNPNSSSFGGLKFTYEAQSQLDVAMLPVSSIKDSPPSSPGSEIGVNPHPAIANQPPAVNTASAAVGGNVRKRGRKAKDSTLATQAAAQAVADLKDVRILQNGGNNSSTASNSATTIGSPLVPAPTPPATPSISVNASSSSASSSTSIIAHTATHMLGNHVNPNSSVAQKLSEQLHMEVQDHAIYTPDSMNSQFTGVPFPGKQRNSTTSSSSGNIANTLVAPNPLQSMFGGGGINGNMPIPQSLEQLLERQWEQGSQFLMEQAQHFDIASLLNCLHQLQSENLRLEEHVTSLIARRDHLLAVNARLQIPLSTISNNAKAEAHGK
ncbi:pneumococcal serine-rich repeat protein isoform X5 [Drosophila willistoni]|uniref:pneumococcal serine-rich repeat protein isoform X5 n=1 Tax=Drosophila willistoni TaxID=7260 RepID=UPI000C26CCAF|nr:pneumococcal serine-rich repeat protein isoform X5 [Drosophila willistoni]